VIEIIPNWHPFFVHFTVGLLSTAILFYWASAFLANRYAWKQQWLTMANWCLWTGCLFAIATATAGWIAYNSVAHDAASHAAMTLHRNWALPTAGIFLLLGVWAIILANKDRRPGFLFLMFSLTAGGMLSFTGWLGAEAVYRYGLGVKSLPVVEEGGDGHNHSHSHGSMHDESHGADHDHNTTENEGMMSPGVVGEASDGHNHSHSSIPDESNKSHDHMTESETLMPVEEHSRHNHESQITPVDNNPVIEETAEHSHKSSTTSENNMGQHPHNAEDASATPASVEKNTSAAEKNTIPSEHHHTHKHGDESSAHHHH